MHYSVLEHKLSPYLYISINTHTFYMWHQHQCLFVTPAPVIFKWYHHKCLLCDTNTFHDISTSDFKWYHQQCLLCGSSAEVPSWHWNQWFLSGIITSAFYVTPIRVLFFLWHQHLFFLYHADTVRATKYLAGPR